MMGTRIVSTGLSLGDREMLSRILLVITAAARIALRLLVSHRAVRDLRAHPPRSPLTCALTGVKRRPRWRDRL
jgi:hypothetical protein